MTKLIDLAGFLASEPADAALKDLVTVIAGSCGQISKVVASGAISGSLGAAGQVNVLGGCCGSTPAHIAAIAKAAQGLPPRKIPQLDAVTRLAGLEPFVMAA